MEIPKKIWPPIFFDGFIYRGVSFDLPDEWTAISGQFSTSNEKELICTSPGILRYTGIALSDLLNFTAPNFAWVVRLFGQENTVFTLRVREDHSAGTYLGVKIDFANNQITVIDNGLVLTTHVLDYTLKSASIDYYDIELITMGANDYWVLINGNPVFNNSPVLSGNHVADGFSIEVNSEDEIAFSKFAVHDIVAFPDPPAEEDLSNLFLVFRKEMKEQIENPTERTWETYKAARRLWKARNSFGLSNEQWENLGYPIREPLPEEWLRS